MSNKKNDNEFDPEKDKELKKGPLKPEHRNQYGGNPGGKSRNLSDRAKAEKERKEKK